ncbi:MAG: 3-phosphoserine/phosphohydroxythreonine transaminase, partial [Clostridia bacterium]|nr:3-phosphoserine/phosphohydroxythreonine transaminase [Clostridia bacterium]
MSRVYNFSAGPSMLPEAVLKTAAEQMLDYNGSGMSVMEMSHRSKVYEEIIQTAEADLRELLNIPDNYKVLFLQGGASSLFAMVPLNLMTKNGKADYVITCQWSKKAFSEAQKYGNPRKVASSEDKVFNYIPKLDKSMFDPEADYVHITSNNTIYGTKYHELPDTGNVPLVSDMSSCILSEPVDVSKFGMIYFGAQKNVGPAGVTIAIIREDLIGEPMECTPTMFNLGIHAKNDSLYNTPPCYAIYVCGLVFKYLKEIGGL